MFDKLHLLSQDVPEGGDGFRWRAHPYLRMAGAVPRGPVVFEWSPRQRADLEALWRDPTAEGARERLARDLAVFCDRLGWTPDGKLLLDAEKRGEEYMVTLSAVPPELYILPWEVIQVGAGGTFLSDYASAQVRYAMPGLEPRAIQGAPPAPGVLFAWSGAGGAVPHEEHAAAIRAAAEAGGVAFRELADVDQAGLQAALETGPPSVLHLLCHGRAGAEGEPSRLAWGTADSPSEITATRLARMLRRHDSAIRLVVLSTCGSGDGQDNPMLLGSLAQELHKKGIASVVASRYPLSVSGSAVMARALYDKLLREAWSLERALRHTREALLKVGEDGEAHPGDAYGIQLYAYDTERFRSDNDVEAERPVLASYPFGTAARPVPASAPPAAELTLALAADPSLSEDEMVSRLRRVSEDERLTVAIPLGEDRSTRALSVHTTVDGAQRLMGAWRSRALQTVIGAIVAQVVSTTASGVQSLLSSAASAAARAGTPTSQVGTAGKIAAAAGRAGTPTSQVATTAKVGITASQAGAGAGQVAAAGKAATSVLVIAGKAITAKVAVAALVSTVAVAGGAVVYETHQQSAASVQLAPEGSTAEPPDGVAAAAKTLGADPPGVPGVPGVPADRGAPPSTTQPPPGAPQQPSPGTPVAHASPQVAVGSAGGPVERVAVASVQGAPAQAPATPVPPVSAAPEPTSASRAPATPGATATAPAASAPSAAATAPAAASPGEPAAPGVPGASSAAQSAAGPAQPATLAALSPAAAESPPVARPAPSAVRSAAGPAQPATPGAPSPPAAAAASPGAPPAPVAPVPAAAASRPAHAVCGNGIVEPGEQCDDGNSRDGDGCSSKCAADAVVKGPVSVEPSVLTLHRISGNTDVRLSKETKDAMLRDHMDSPRAVLQLCVDRTGLVTESTLMVRTGYTEFDSRVIEAVREWQFRPYMVGSTPVKMCSTVDFVYNLPR